MEEGALQARADIPARAARRSGSRRRRRCRRSRGEQRRLDHVQLLALRLGLGADAASLAANRWRRAELRRDHWRPHRGASTVVVQVVRQDVLSGELDPGGFPRRYQYLVDSGVGELTSTARATTCAGRDAMPRTLTTWTYADTGEPRRPPAGQGVVGDRAARQRDQRGLTALVGAGRVPSRRGRGTHPSPAGSGDRGRTSGSRPRSGAARRAASALGVDRRGSSAETIGPSSTATARSSRGAVDAVAGRLGSDDRAPTGSSGTDAGVGSSTAGVEGSTSGCCAAPAARAAGGDCR